MIFGFDHTDRQNADVFVEMNIQTEVSSQISQYIWELRLITVLHIGFPVLDQWTQDKRTRIKQSAIHVQMKDAGAEFLIFQSGQTSFLLCG